MNRVILMGRLTRDPEVRYPAGENTVDGNYTGNNQTAFGRYTLAVDRRFSRRDDNGSGQSADFISCVVFGKGAEFAEKYLRQGMKIVVTGRIQTGSYINRDGQKIYTTDVVVEDQEFAESRSAGADNRKAEHPQNEHGSRPPVDASGFMNIPDGFDDDLPFDP